MLLKPDFGSLNRGCKLESVGIAVVEKRVAPSHIKIPDSSPPSRSGKCRLRDFHSQIICDPKSTGWSAESNLLEIPVR
jgi:hypothetical protein